MPAAPCSDRIGDVERLGVEPILEMADAADLLEILVGQDRLAHFKALAARGAFKVEDVGPRPDEGDEAHDELFADRVDRRVRHLREVLLEVGVEQLRLVRQRRDRRVRAHRADRFLAGHRHGRHQELQVFLRVAEGLLAIEQRHVRARVARLDGLQVLEHDLRALQPVLIGIARATSCCLISSSETMRPCSRSISSILPGCKPPLRRRSSLPESAARPSRTRERRGRRR